MTLERMTKKELISILNRLNKDKNTLYSLACKIEHVTDGVVASQSQIRRWVLEALAEVEGKKK